MPFFANHFLRVLYTTKKKKKNQSSSKREILSGPNGKYIVKEVIGDGAYSTVYKAKKIKPSPPCVAAIKEIDLEKLSHEDRRYFYSEIAAMQALSHPTIVRIMDSWVARKKPEVAYIAMECVFGSTLGDVIWDKDYLDETIARKYFVQLIEAVDHCHKHGVRHRDIKPDNIIVEKDEETIKLCDFGFASVFETEGKTLHSPKLYSPVGTKNFRAQEVEMVSRKGYSGASTDIYACGVTLLVMLTGWPDDEDELQGILHSLSLYADNSSFWNNFNVSCSAKELICGMISPYGSRFTLGEVKGHPWSVDRFNSFTY